MSFDASSPENPHECRKNAILPETRVPGIHYYRLQYEFIFITFYIIAKNSKPTKTDFDVKSRFRVIQAYKVTYFGVSEKAMKD